MTDYNSYAAPSQPSPPVRNSGWKPLILPIALIALVTLLVCFLGLKGAGLLRPSDGDKDSVRNLSSEFIRLDTSDSTSQWLDKNATSDLTLDSFESSSGYFYGIKDFFGEDELNVDEVTIGKVDGSVEIDKYVSGENYASASLKGKKKAAGILLFAKQNGEWKLSDIQTQ